MSLMIKIENYKRNIHVSNYIRSMQLYQLNCAFDRPLHVSVPYLLTRFL